MNQFSKMVMVPQGMVDPLRNQEPMAPLLNQLSTMDQQMHSILFDASLPDELKQQKYMQTLQRYQNLKGQQLDAFMPKPVQAVEDTVPDENILEAIPKNYRNKAKILVQHLKKHPEFQWTRDGELKMNGNAIEGSNFTDLVYDFVMRTGNAVIPGGKEFSRLLKDTKVPQVALAKKKNPVTPVSPRPGPSRQFRSRLPVLAVPERAMVDTPKRNAKGRQIPRALQSPVEKDTGIYSSPRRPYYKTWSNSNKS